MKKLVSNQLRDLGVPTNLKGYRYIEEAILEGIEADDNYLDGITKYLYPSLAKKFNTTAPRVERAIRHAIEVSMLRGDMDIIGEIFGSSMNQVQMKPTNKEYLSGIIHHLKTLLEPKEDNSSESNLELMSCKELAKSKYGREYLLGYRCDGCKGRGFCLHIE